MKLSVIGLVAASLLLAGSAFASEEMATKNNCLGCHKMDGKAMGPSIKEMASADGATVERYAAAIKDGTKKKEDGKTIWGGPMAMPPQPNAAADAEALAKWIMEQK
ncbi:MAG: cytochrome C' [Candidatus Electrothrix sp. AR1]|nr:cytochrome C' [Candidatus Electrothrix sp. AR1]